MRAGSRKEAGARPRGRLAHATERGSVLRASEDAMLRRTTETDAFTNPVFVGPGNAQRRASSDGLIGMH